MKYLHHDFYIVPILMNKQNHSSNSLSQKMSLERPSVHGKEFTLNLEYFIRSFAVNDSLNVKFFNETSFPDSTKA